MNGDKSTMSTYERLVYNYNKQMVDIDGTQCTLQAELAELDNQMYSAKTALKYVQADACPDCSGKGWHVQLVCGAAVKVDCAPCAGSGLGN
jgi:hypothetical protein